MSAALQRFASLVAPPARASRPLRFLQLLRRQSGTSLMQLIGSYRALHFSKAVQGRKSSSNQILPAFVDITDARVFAELRPLWRGFSLVVSRPDDLAGVSNRPLISRFLCCHFWGSLKLFRGD
jgi:hypothetical protein